MVVFAHYTDTTPQQCVVTWRRAVSKYSHPLRDILPYQSPITNTPAPPPHPLWPRHLPHLLPLGVHVVLDDDGGLTAAHASLGQTIRVDLLGQHDQGGLSGLADLLEAVFELVVVDGGVVAHGANGGQLLQNLVVADLGLHAACGEAREGLSDTQSRRRRMGGTTQRTTTSGVVQKKRKRWNMECIMHAEND